MTSNDVTTSGPMEDDVASGNIHERDVRKTMWLVKSMSGPGDNDTSWGNVYVGGGGGGRSRR